VRRTKLVLATLVVMVAAFTAFGGPVMAEEFDCHDARGYKIVCDGETYVPFDREYQDYYSPYDFSGYDGSGSYGSEEYFDYLENTLEEYEDFIEDRDDYNNNYYYPYYGW
jgi:hypothetical protein